MHACIKLGRSALQRGKRALAEILHHYKQGKTGFYWALLGVIVTNKIKGFIERGIKCQNLDFYTITREKNTHEYFLLIMNIDYEIGVYV